MESKLHFYEANEKSIAQLVFDFFFHDESLCKFFEDWCRSKAYMISIDTEENKLEYTSLHKDFLRIFEDKLTEFIDSHDSSIEEFYAELAKMPMDSEEDLFVQVLNATTDFEVFIQMMHSTATLVNEEQEAKHIAA